MAKKPLLSKKVIVTNRGALVGKYGTKGLARIKAAVDAVIAADAARGFGTSLVYLDGTAGSWPKVKDPADQVENKEAIDGLVKALAPEYLVLLGSHDVVPFQDLRNPLFDAADPDGDPDRFAPSDLPYACEAPFSQKITNFLGPTRVVGRLPDLTGASDPQYLLDLLALAAGWKGSPPPETALALSAKVWEKSTKLSVRNLLGAGPSVLTSPKEGPKFSAKQLGERLHFVNCHGAQLEHRFFGEGPPQTYFDALDATRLAGLREGSVAAFECCYGAELYAPAGLPSPSIANAYLQAGVYGLVASTTVAYGPADSNENADVLCQLFLEQVLRGASLGRAFLEARLGYLRLQSVVDPYDEKTLAQFVLLGDPSIHPFAEAAPAAKGMAMAQSAESAVAARAQRRVRLMKSGMQLGRTSAYTAPVRKASPAIARLQAEVSRRDSGFGKVRVFQVREPKGEGAAVGKAFGQMPRARHVFIALRSTPTNLDSILVRLEGLLAYEVEGVLVERQLFSR